MFVYNVKIPGSKVFKSIFILMLVVIMCIVGVVVFKILNGAKNSSISEACMPKNKICTISSNNYTNVLKAVHDNIDDYVGMKINFTRICISCFGFERKSICFSKRYDYFF